MKFHKPDLNFQVLKSKVKLNYISIGILLIGVAVITGILLYSYAQVKMTYTIIRTNKTCIQNQLIKEEDFEFYNISRVEFDRALMKTESGQLVNRYILKDYVKQLADGKHYYGYTLKAHAPVQYDDVLPRKQDNTRMFLYKYPGKSIVPLSLAGNSMSAFKKKLEVGDRINISCIFKKTMSSTVVKTNIKVKTTTEAYFDYDMMDIEEVFKGVEIADILNAKGDSLLDYKYEIDALPENKKQEVLDSEEYKESIKASTLLLALTPAEEQRLNLYQKKEGATFNVTIPPMYE